MSEAFRILIIEDDETLNQILSQVLREQGYLVESAGSGEQALALARDTPFDLVVADIRMEGMDGLDAIDALSRQRPSMRRLVITGYSTEADSIRAIRLGVDDYLKKPIHLQVFLEAVRKIVAKRRQQQKEAERELTLRRTTCWALEAMARSLPRDGPELTFYARAGRSMAEAMEMAPHVCEDIRLAVLAAGLRQFPKAGALPPDSLSASVHLLLEGEGLSSPAGLVVQAVLEAWSRGDAGVADPGRYPPQLLELLERYASEERTEEESVEGGDGVRRRLGLAALGRALEEAGEHQAAGQAFSESLRHREDSREAIEGLLGLARLARSEGRAEEAREQVARAVRTARRTGPVSLAWTALESAFLLESEERQAEAALREAGKLFSRLEVPEGLALSRLALDRLRGTDEGVAETLPVLLRPEHFSELAAAAHWLLPFLLELQGRSPTALTAQATALLVREFPRQLFEWLTRGATTSPARRAAAEALVGASGAWADSCLRRLLVDPDTEVRDHAGRVLRRQEQPVAVPYLRLYSFGAFEAYLGEDAVTGWKSKTVRYLLACLAAHGGRPVPDDLLLEAFFTTDLRKTRANLHAATSHLRAHLKPPGWQGRELNYVVRDSAGLRLNPELPRWHDLEELERVFALAVEADRNGKADSALTHHRRVAHLHRGVYLEGCYMDWALGRRTQIESKVLCTLDRLARSARDPQEALEYSGRALVLDPYHQGANLVTMEASLAAGRPQQAVLHFEKLRGLLAEVELEPSIDLLRAYEKARLSL